MRAAEAVAFVEPRGVAPFEHAQAHRQAGRVGLGEDGGEHVAAETAFLPFVCDEKMFDLKRVVAAIRKIERYPSPSPGGKMRFQRRDMPPSATTMKTTLQIPIVIGLLQNTERSPWLM